MQAVKKPSKAVVINSIVLLVLGFSALLAGWEAKSMRTGTALLYKDTKIPHLYKYYPILLIVSLILIIVGLVLLVKIIKYLITKISASNAETVAQDNVTQAADINDVNATGSDDRGVQSDNANQAENAVLLDTNRPDSAANLLNAVYAGSAEQPKKDTQSENTIQSVGAIQSEGRSEATNRPGCAEQPSGSVKPDSTAKSENATLSDTTVQPENTIQAESKTSESVSKFDTAVLAGPEKTICPNCNYVNEPTSKFCGKCGSRLAV